MSARRFIPCAVACSLLNGCGTYVPQLQEFYDTQTAETMVAAIVEHVQCEVKTGVQFLILDDIDAAAEAKTLGLNQGLSVNWLEKWAAQVTLTLTIDEKSAISPTATDTPITTVAQTFSVAIGGTASADGTRKETLAWLINFAPFSTPQALKRARLIRDQVYKASRANGADPVALLCDQQNGGLIQGDLKLWEWLHAVTLLSYVRGGAVPNYSQTLQAEAKAAKKDVIAHEITFVILYGGNVTPSWKLVRVSVNQGSQPLLSAQRTRTQDLQITMGPAPGGVPSQSVQNTTLASQIGLAVANAIRNTQ